MSIHVTASVDPSISSNSHLARAFYGRACLLKIYRKADTIRVDSATAQSVLSLQLCHQLDTCVVVVGEVSMTLVQVVLADIEHCLRPHVSQRRAEDSAENIALLRCR